MVLKRKSVKKLASLSAFGAGALVLGAKPMDASVIYSGAINVTVGFAPGDLASYTSPALGAGGPNFKFTAVSGFSVKHVNSYKKILFNKTGNLLFAAGGSVQLILAEFAANATWGVKTANQVGTKGLVESRFIGGGHTPFAYNLAGPGPFSNQYALINFGPGNSLYGWIQLSLQVDKSSSSSGTHGPNLTIIDFAYDDSGTKIQAGVTTGPVGPGPGPTVPEPGTLESAGLAALALGAVGLRRWRAVRKAA
jgi:hypothetical protein